MKKSTLRVHGDAGSTATCALFGVLEHSDLIFVFLKTTKKKFVDKKKNKKTVVKVMKLVVAFPIWFGFDFS